MTNTGKSINEEITYDSKSGNVHSCCAEEPTRQYVPEKAYNGFVLAAFLRHLLCNSLT